jgi:NADPH-dependent curcumin reductase CurA
MRNRMDPGPSYLPPFEVGAPLDGAAVGEVVASRAPAVAEGDVVTHRAGWRSWAVLKAQGVRRIDTDLAPVSAHLGILGAPGWTAYVGLLDVGQLRDGDVVFVSAAAGAVGSVVVQIARLLGHRVVGSAGSAEKVRHVRGDLGADVAFDYHDAPVTDLLAGAAPDGIDLYFDNVGGDHLEAALESMRSHGRVVACGAISRYDVADAPPGPRNLHLLFVRRITMRGFIVLDHRDRFADFQRDMAAWLRAGRIVHRETVVRGLEHAPRALIGLLHGENVGKMVVEVG